MNRCFWLTTVSLYCVWYNFSWTNVSKFNMCAQSVQSTLNITFNRYFRISKAPKHVKSWPSSWWHRSDELYTLLPSLSADEVRVHTASFTSTISSHHLIDFPSFTYHIHFLAIESNLLKTPFYNFQFVFYRPSV